MVLLSVNRAIINDLNVVLHGFMFQIIYTTVFWVKRLNNRGIHIIYAWREQAYKGTVVAGSYGSWIYNYLCNQCLSPLMLSVRISIIARCTTLCDKVCQWLATGLWFCPDSPVSSTNKTDRHDIAEILLKVALNTIKQTNKQIYKQ